MKEVSSVVLLRVVMASIILAAGLAGAAPQVPCFFIFGDSLVDNGNNNGILTLARANYMPYGIDFPQGASGRFNNGRTTVDVLAQLLGFRDYIPPYAGTEGSAILRGLNFASGAGGIRDETGNNLGDHFAFGDQMDNFRDTVAQMGRLFRGNSSRLNDYLGRCMFYVGMGSNDYLNNYFMPNMYTSSYQYSPKTYASLLLQDYEHYVKEMYDLGARKVVIAGVGPIGCIPYQLARLEGNSSGSGSGGNSRCNDKINRAIGLFNAGLANMVRRFNYEADDAKFVFLNSFESSRDLLQNAASYGFDVLDRGCCGVGKNNGQITCLPLQQPCEDRGRHIFWDAFHPTEAANVVYAKKAYYSTSKQEVYPMNIRQLAMA